MTSCYEETVLFDGEPTGDLQLLPLFKLEEINCSYDAEMAQLRYYLPGDSLTDFHPMVEFQEGAEVYFEGIQIKNNKRIPLVPARINHPYQIEIFKDGNSKKLELVFTNLPIVQIVCDQNIYDEPKSLARIQINNYKKGESFSSFAGIEFRGRYSREYKKKSMGFTLWEGITKEKAYSKYLLGLQKNSEWILGAAFIDPSRIRNMVSFEIWNDLQTRENHLGIHSEMVEVFLNNKFQGIYIFSELLNAELLKVGNEAVLYKGVEWADGASTFNRYNSEISENQFWNGWEQKIPDRREKINWAPLASLYHTVVDEPNDGFKLKIEDHLNLENIIDYYLFLNLTLAIDNTGKNSFLFTKDEHSPFQYIPWDLDGSWGRLYDGSKVGSDILITNNLFERLLDTNPNNFRQKMKSRWFYLRENNFSEENIRGVFNRHIQKLNASDIIQKENQIWDVDLDINKEHQYILNWMKDRLAFLDIYMNNI